jgi:hypothetical protein
MSVVMATFLAQAGGRRIIGVIFGAAMVAWLLLQDRIKPRIVIAGAVCLALLLVIMQLMLEYRMLGLSAMFRETGPELQLSHLRVDDNFLRLAQVTELFPDTAPFADLQPLYYALTKPIPRYFWPGKPIDPGYDLTALVGMAGLSLSHTIVGELYAAHGLIVVFVGGLFLGRIANMWNKILLVPGGIGKPMIYGLGIMVLVAGLRGAQDLVVMTYGILGWLVISSIVVRVRSGRAPAGKH